MKKHIENFRDKMIKESDDLHDMSYYSGCLSCLKKVRNGIDKQSMILWFNENDIDYFNWTDLDMYIYYIEKNS